MAVNRPPPGFQAPPPGLSGNPTPASMKNKGQEKAGAGMAGTGKTAALVTPKKEVTSSGSSDIRPPPGFSGNPTPASMKNKGKGNSEVTPCTFFFAS